MANGREKADTIRAFIAADISEQVRERIGEIRTELELTDAGVRWTKPSSIHLTLRFLGNITEARVGPAGQALAEAARGVEPVRVEVGGYGMFPSERRPRVIWLGLEKGGPELFKIFERLEVALEARGFGPADKKFSPHLTLGRLKSGKGMKKVVEVLSREATKGFGQYRVDRLFLFKSELHPRGAVYTALTEQKLPA